MKKIIFVYVFVSCISGTASAFEATVITNPGEVDQLNGPWTLGYTFKPNIDLKVTALGSFAPRVPYARQIGIWDSAGTLLMSASVDGTESVLNYMNYTSGISTFTSSGLGLMSGATYTVGATVIRGSGNWSLNPTFLVDSNITFGQSRFSPGGTLAFPKSFDPLGLYFGGSFQAVPRDLAQPVPEPCTTIALAASALAYWRRRTLATPPLFREM